MPSLGRSSRADRRRSGRASSSSIPRSCEPCADGRIGEIWVSSPSVARGYWRRERETRRDVRCRLANGDGPFLRTGDLGVLCDGELFVTGRLKDLLIVRGLKHYPQDIELTAERQDVALRPGCSAAFALDGEEGEAVGIALEVDPRELPADPTKQRSAFRRSRGGPTRGQRASWHHAVGRLAALDRCDAKDVERKAASARMSCCAARWFAGRDRALGGHVMRAQARRPVSRLADRIAEIVGADASRAGRSDWPVRSLRSARNGLAGRDGADRGDRGRAGNRAADDGGARLSGARCAVSLHRGGRRDDAPSAASSDMRADAVLPDDIAPSSRATRRGDARRAKRSAHRRDRIRRRISASRTRRSNDGEHSLSRSRSGDGMSRVAANLERYGLWSDELAARLRVVPATSPPLLGLGHDEFNNSHRAIDAIYHAAADVNWVLGYDALRDTNVLGTANCFASRARECQSPSTFSRASASVIRRAARARRRERRPMLALDGLWLGYAQSKCVAEALVRAAGERGLAGHDHSPVARHWRRVDRPIESRRSDVAIHRRLHSYATPRPISIGEWTAFPSTTCARRRRACVRTYERGMRRLHLTADSPRHWRECVLWMRLCGYDIELIPYREWTEMLRATGRGASAARSAVVLSAADRGRESSHPARVVRGVASPAVSAASTRVALGAMNEPPGRRSTPGSWRATSTTSSLATFVPDAPGAITRHPADGVALASRAVRSSSRLRPTTASLPS